MLSTSSAPAGPPSAADSPWLKGYARTIAGETLGYHSPYPDATSALLVRAADGTMAIEWETEPVPASGAGAEPFLTFVWMCGLATGKGAHKFDLSIDGKPAFSFRTSRDATERNWEILGPDGASLAFRTTMVDQFDELFGFMFLKLPRLTVQPGRPLRLKVVGENGGSRDWHMVFQYDLRPFIQASGEQAVMKTEGKAGQLVRLAVSHLAPPAGASLAVDGILKKEVVLETGYNTFYLPIDVVREPRRAAVDVAIEGRAPVRIEVALRPVAKRTFFLLPHSHADIGYSDPQVKVERDHWSYFEQAAELARRTSGYPEGARFKWNTEVLWAVETYLRQAAPAKRDAFIQAVREGSIGLQALLANELTGVCHPEELFELTAYARRLSREYGLTIDSAMITDIPSYTWSVVPALAQSGVKYFSSGPNYMPNLTDGGDRIGGALQAWGDKPVYWVSPSGREKVLLWMAGRGYSWFHGLNMGKLDSDKPRPFLDYCRELEDKNYPYQMVQVRYTVGGDNGPPDPSLPDKVRRWNEEFETPKLVIATAHDMFAEFERRYGDQIPSVKGDFTPYWEDGAASTALETSLNRRSAVRLLQAQTLWAMLKPKAFPAADFEEAWRQALLWDEHTWGAADSVNDPDSENSRLQWETKRAFAVEADRRSRSLLAAAVDLPGKAGRGLLVLNTCSWDRSGIVRLSGNDSKTGDRVTDADDRPVLSQRLTTGELALKADGVPAFGSKTYTFGPGLSALPDVGRASAAGTTLENGRVKIIIDPVSGAVASFLWAARENVEFVDRSALPGLNSYFYVPGLDPQTAVGIRTASIKVKEKGPLVASLLVESEAPGCKGLVREYVLSADSDRLEIIDRLDKRKVRDKEAVHIGFPFRVPGGGLRLDLGWGWIRPDADLIAGACRDFFGLQNSADISNSDYGVTWVSLDVPLAEVGAMTDETRADKGTRRWRTSLDPAQTLYSYVMNNYWHTNYKADQEGPVELRYAVEPHLGRDPQTAKRIGLDFERPLVAVPGAAAPDPASPVFRVSPAAAMITSLKPTADGRGLIARIFNASDRTVDAAIVAPPGVSIVLTDPDGIPVAPLSGRFPLAPFEIITVRLETAGR